MYFCKPMNIKTIYEPVIGLEVHVQLSTKSKLFARNENNSDAQPNTCICPITMGHPGTLPQTNQKAIDYAIKIGITFNSVIANEIFFDRKNYFYPDLPKGYQITQNTLPICSGGRVPIKINQEIKWIQLNRIHLEEDAGKSMHDADANYSYIDLNRAGTPLIEIVTEPCIHSAEEAFLYVQQIRKIVKWINISNGNLEEGSIRCDANISIRPKGETTLGKKVEVKNINSFRNIKKAIEYEISRMTKALENGETIEQQTRSFNQTNDTTFALRDKEDSNDYRYFIDPDLPHYFIDKNYISQIEKQLPELPYSMEQKFKEKYQLQDYDIEQLTESLDSSQFYEKLVFQKLYFKAAANFTIGPIKEFLNQHKKEYSEIEEQIPLIQELIEMVEEDKINFSVANQKVLPIVLIQKIKPSIYCQENNLIQSQDNQQLQIWIQQIIQSMPEKVKEYNQGKKGLIGLFIGELKRISQGKANPATATQLLQETLNNIKNKK